MKSRRFSLRFVCLFAMGIVGASCSVTTQPKSQPNESRSSIASSKDAASNPVVAGQAVTRVVLDRPFQVHVPKNYSSSKPAPLLIVLHGYTGSSVKMQRYFALRKEADERGVLTVYPDGNTDPTGNQFWNATDACCDLFASGADDSTYLRALLDDVRKGFAVDPKAIYFAGHSNGGFMSYRMACEHSDVVTAVVSLAGATWDDPSKCRPLRPVSVAQVHGTNDASIQFGGGAVQGHAFPSTETTISQWAAYDGCAGELSPPQSSKLDLESSIEGAETTVRTVTNCPDTIGVELWTINSGVHIPALTKEFAVRVLDFFAQHRKP